MKLTENSCILVNEAFEMNSSKTSLDDKYPLGMTEKSLIPEDENVLVPLTTTD